MSRILIAALSFGLGIFAAGLSFTAASNDTNQPLSVTGPAPLPAAVSTPSQFCKHFDFHWLELQNYKASESRRRIDVFMDDEAFTETNLKELFSYLSQVNTEQSGLIVMVYTDWSQFSNPSPSCPGTACGECNSDHTRDEHLRATYWRLEDTEYFRYSLREGDDDANFKTVAMNSSKRLISK